MSRSVFRRCCGLLRTGRWNAAFSFFTCHGRRWAGSTARLKLGRMPEGVLERVVERLFLVPTRPLRAIIFVFIAFRIGIHLLTYRCPRANVQSHCSCSIMPAQAVRADDLYELVITSHPVLSDKGNRTADSRCADQCTNRRYRYFGHLYHRLPPLTRRFHRFCAYDRLRLRPVQ
jgi:hypothetical protein